MCFLSGFWMSASLCATYMLKSVGEDSQNLSLVPFYLLIGVMTREVRANHLTSLVSYFLTCRIREFRAMKPKDT